MTFLRFGTPVEVVSDGGSQFTCKAFEDFSQEWGFQHTVSSPTHAQANGKAEAAVKNVKKLLKKCGSMNHDEFLTPTTRKKILHAKSKEKLYYDQHTKVLPPLELGSCVAIRSRNDTDWSLLGTVIEIRPNCTFAVETDRGSVLIRNRKYLKLTI